MLIAACVISYLKSRIVLDELSTISSYFMLATILFGIAVALYVIYTKDQVFDPLNSSLDENPKCEEDDKIRLS
jgi:predicted permease